MKKQLRADIQSGKSARSHSQHALDQNRLPAVDYLASRLTVGPLCWTCAFTTRPPVFARVL
jgi:hypothetical protein